MTKDHSKYIQNERAEQMLAHAKCRMTQLSNFAQSNYEFP